MAFGLTASLTKRATFSRASGSLALGSAGVKCVVAARLEPGDVDENEAALKLAKRLAGQHLRCSAPFTGRVNLFAEGAGLAIVEPEAIDRVNAVDEAITVATLPRYRAVADGDMVATVKIIPFATQAPTLETALAACADGRDLCSAVQADADRGGLDDAPGPEALDRGEDVARARGAPQADRSAHRRPGDRSARAWTACESARAS